MKCIYMPKCKFDFMNGTYKCASYQIKLIWYFTSNAVTFLVQYSFIL